MSLILKRSPDEIVSRLVALKFLPTRNPHDALLAEYLRRSLRCDIAGQIDPTSDQTHQNPP
jgi:hypothetical protein